MEAIKALIDDIVADPSSGSYNVINYASHYGGGSNWDTVGEGEGALRYCTGFEEPSRTELVPRTFGESNGYGQFGTAKVASGIKVTRGTFGGKSFFRNSLLWQLSSDSNF